MFKNLILLLVLTSAIYCQTQNLRKQFMVGSFIEKTQQEIKQLEADPYFVNLVKKVRIFWYNEANQTLGEIIGLAEQIVAGSNFKITFSGEKKNHEVTVIVFVQPWSSIQRVTYTDPKLRNLDNADLTLITV